MGEAEIKKEIKILKPKAILIKAEPQENPVGLTGRRNKKHERSRNSKRTY